MCVNVREFDSCQWNVMKLNKSRGNISGKMCLKKLFIANLTFMAMLVFSNIIRACLS